MTTVDIKILDERIREMPPAYATPGAAGGISRMRSSRILISTVVMSFLEMTEG